MKVAISGTYSSGKTLTVMALSHYTGLPKVMAKAIREIMPIALPGKRLSDVTPAEFLNLMVQRHIGRVLGESRLTGDFVSDGSSLQEWLYGEARLAYGMNPANPGDRVAFDEEMQFFGKVVKEFSRSFKHHVKSTYDCFVHLRHELPLVNDGHRPMSDAFRAEIDTMLLATLREMGMPFYIVEGSLEDRLTQIAGLLHVQPILPIEHAIALADDDYRQLDLRLETERSG
jgi:hypothetical protein